MHKLSSWNDLPDGRRLVLGGTDPPEGLLAHLRRLRHHLRVPNGRRLCGRHQLYGWRRRLLCGGSSGISLRCRAFRKRTRPNH